MENSVASYMKIDYNIVYLFVIYVFYDGEFYA